MFIQHHRKNFRRIGWLAIVAVLLPTLVSLVHHPVQKRDVVAQLQTCPMHGTMPVDNEKAPASKIPSCPICLSLHLLGGGFVAPELVALTAVLHDHQVFQLSELSFTPHRSISTGQPRAPPVLA